MVYNSNTKFEIRRTDEFAQWLRGLKDSNAKARVNIRIRRISLTGNLGDSKPVGDGVFELRIDYGAGYRLYFSNRESGIILLLIGGDKSSQRRDIEKAKKLNRQYE